MSDGVQIIISYAICLSLFCNDMRVTQSIDKVAQQTIYHKTHGLYNIISAL